MISTRWFQGKSNLDLVLELRSKVFIDELKIKDYPVADMYDEFALNAVAYEGDIPVGTGRLLFKDGKYSIDNVCVLSEFRGNHYGDLLLRVLVRRAVNMGAEKTYALVTANAVKNFEAIGFAKLQENDGYYLMEKTGDVGGSCGNCK